MQIYICYSNIAFYSIIICYVILYNMLYYIIISGVQSLICVQLFVTSWTATRQASIHQIPELTQTHFHAISDAIQQSHPLLSTSPSTFNISQHQGFLPMNQFLVSGSQLGLQFSTGPSNERVFRLFSSVTQLYLTLCDPMDCSMQGFPVHHQLPELTQTHDHQVSDAIQPSHPLLSPSPAFNLSQHQGLFK